MSDSKLNLASEILIALINSDKRFFSIEQNKDDENIDKITNAFQKIYETLESVKDSK